MKYLATFWNFLFLIWSHWLRHPRAKENKMLGGAATISTSSEASQCIVSGMDHRAVVVAGDTERSPLAPEDRGANSVARTFLEILSTVNCILKNTKVKKKRPRMVQSVHLAFSTHNANVTWNLCLDVDSKFSLEICWNHFPFYANPIPAKLWRSAQHDSSRFETGRVFVAKTATMGRPT